MRKRIWLAFVVIAVACVLLLFKATQHRETALPEQRATPTDQSPGRSEPQKAVQRRQRQEPSRATAVPPDAAAPAAASAATPGDSNAVAAQMLASWQAPIEFYGKALDENSNAVAGAKVTFHWVEAPKPDGNRSSTTESDANGLFSLQGARGPSLTVSVSKEGYYTSRQGLPVFRYGLFQDGNFSPDPRNPVIFNLRKQGKRESLITSAFPAGMGQIAQLHHDGTPVELDLSKGTQVPAGSGQLKLEFWRAVTNRNANIFDWKCQLTVPGGGLVETPEEFAFQAPESGYQPLVVIDMPATSQDWKGDIRTKYYIQLPDGRYGRIDFYFLAFNGVFAVQAAVNPTGSRNLEPSS